jgi:hypothetical protein
LGRRHTPQRAENISINNLHEALRRPSLIISGSGRSRRLSGNADLEPLRAMAIILPASRQHPTQQDVYADEPQHHVYLFSTSGEHARLHLRKTENRNSKLEIRKPQIEIRKSKSETRQ